MPKTKTYTQEQLDTQLLIEKVNGLVVSMTNLTLKVEQSFVTKQEFKPVQMIAYGLVSVLLTGVLGYFLFAIVKH